MFGIGMTELVVILVIGLLVLGPKRLPELARSLGKGLAEFRRASTDLRREFIDVADEARIDRSPPPSPAKPEAERQAGAQPDRKAERLEDSIPPVAPAVPDAAAPDGAPGDATAAAKETPEETSRG